MDVLRSCAGTMRTKLQRVEAIVARQGAGQVGGRLRALRTPRREKSGLQQYDPAAPRLRQHTAGYQQQRLEVALLGSAGPAASWRRRGDLRRNLIRQPRGSPPATPRMPRADAGVSNCRARRAAHRVPQLTVGAGRHRDGDTRDSARGAHGADAQRGDQGASGQHGGGVGGGGGAGSGGARVGAAGGRNRKLCQLQTRNRDAACVSLARAVAVARPLSIVYRSATMQRPCAPPARQRREVGEKERRGKQASAGERTASAKSPAGAAPEKAAADAAGQPGEAEAAVRVRFFVGGISGGVTADDVRGRFTPFGAVLGVQMVSGKLPGVFVLPLDTHRPASNASLFSTAYRAKRC